MVTTGSPVRYRPADQFPPLKSASEQVASYARWNVPLLLIGAFQAVAPVAGRKAFLVPQGSWARLDAITFSTVAAAPYLGTVGQQIYWQLTSNGVPIPGYTNVVMNAPQSDGVSAELTLPMTLVIPPGTPQTIGVSVLQLSGAILPYAAALVRGWVWSEISDALWRSGESQ